MKFIYSQFVIVTLFTIFACSPALASEKIWTQTNESGFGDSQNTSATLFKIWGQLFAVTDNTAGVQLYQYDVSKTTWDQITDEAKWGFLADANNVAVSAKVKTQGSTVLLAFTNTVTGAEVWQVQATGASGPDFLAKQINYDGFGNSGYTAVLHILDFNNRVLAYVQNSGDGKVRVLRQPSENSNSWELLTDLDIWANGLDAAADYEDVIYIANGDPAVMYTSSDGKKYTRSEVFDKYSAAYEVGQITLLKTAKKGGHLFAAGTTRRFCYETQQKLSFIDDGVDWVLDSSRPSKAFCYTHIVSKPNTNTMYVLGFDVEDGVIYHRNDNQWTEQSAEGLVGNDNQITSTNNRMFSDGIWYRGDIVLATENTKDGTQVWTKQ